MKGIAFALLLIHVYLVPYCQKIPLSIATLNSFPKIESEKISNDGKYVTFRISSERILPVVTFIKVDGSWKMEIYDADNATITEDSRRGICDLTNDTLEIIELGTDNLIKIPNVAEFEIPRSGNGKWIAYKTKGPNQDLVLFNLWSGERKKFNNIINYLFSENGETLVMLLDSLTGNFKTRSLLWYNLNNQKIDSICQDCNAIDLTLDRIGSQLAFLQTKTSVFQKEINAIRYYKIGMDSAVTKFDDSTHGMEGMRLNHDGLYFSDDGRHLFFSVYYLPDLKTRESGDMKTDPVIWNYKDQTLQDYSYDNTNYTAVINFNASGFIKLESDSDFMEMAGNYYSNNFVIVKCNFEGYSNDYNWRPSAKPSIYLVSLNNGIRKLIHEKMVDADFYFSTSGKYVIWYDREEKNWFTYSIKSGITRNITQKIKDLIYRDDDAAGYPRQEGMAGWLINDQFVLLYDRYDIWQVDPEGVIPPVNITHGYGRKNHLRLRYIDFNQNHPTPFGNSDSLLLSFFDQITKYNGFMRVKLGNSDELIKYPFQSQTYYFPFRYSPANGSNQFFPLKAKYANTYLFKRMSAEEFPNLWVTSDFEKFQSVTNLAPQKNYNWYKSELIHWKLLNGKVAEGILYKPTDFDPKKKYPLIFYYYERSADALNTYIYPGLTNGGLNIPWLVSNGYLVFVPDIYYRVGYPGRSAYNSVVSAAMYLSKMYCVDRHKLGLDGFSFGGFETNYIVTHTSIFSAAVTGAGAVDLIADAGVLKNRSGGHAYYEMGQGRIGASIWERPDLYIENSPIFKADRVATPLLILHNKLDSSVPISQGYEWLTGLRRLGKKAWMIQYTDENHQVLNEKNQIDFAIRTKQFFDHYLKGAPPPKWMTDGGTSLELDMSGRKP